MQVVDSAPQKRSRGFVTFLIIAVLLVVSVGAFIGVRTYLTANPPHKVLQVHHDTDVDGNQHCLVAPSGETSCYTSVAAAEAAASGTASTNSNSSAQLGVPSLPSGLITGGGGWTITIYHDINFGGSSYTFSENQGEMCGAAYPYTGSSWRNGYSPLPSGWNAVTSSFKVNPNSDCAHATLYSGYSYTGHACSWPIAEYGWSIWWVGPTCNDQAVSILLTA